MFGVLGALMNEMKTMDDQASLHQRELGCTRSRGGALGRGRGRNRAFFGGATEEYNSHQMN
jgi:hypothetical protein